MCFKLALAFVLGALPLLAVCSQPAAHIQRTSLATENGIVDMNMLISERDYVQRFGYALAFPFLTTDPDPAASANSSAAWQPSRRMLWAGSSNGMRTKNPLDQTLLPPLRLVVAYLSRISMVGFTETSLSAILSKLSLVRFPYPQRGDYLQAVSSPQSISIPVLPTFYSQAHCAPRMDAKVVISTILQTPAVLGMQ